MTKTIRTTTRSRVAAEAIRDRLPFTTSGNFHGEAHPNGVSYLYSGYLRGLDAEALRRDLAARTIDYVVWSYSTPIAWHRTDGGWHIVSQSFSVTTYKHQSNLYLVTPNTPWPTRKWCGMKGGVNQGYDVIDDVTGAVIGHADTARGSHEIATYYRNNPVSV